MQNYTERAVEDGRSFHASKRYSALANNGTAALFLDNPAGSGKDFRFTQFTIVGTGDAWINVNVDVTQSVAGTALTIHNDRIGDAGSETSAATVEFGGTYTGRAADPYVVDVLPGGTKSAGSGGESVSLTYLLREGHNILVEVVNKSGGPNDYAILAFWIEEDHV